MLVAHDSRKQKSYDLNRSLVEVQTNAGCIRATHAKWHPGDLDCGPLWSPAIIEDALDCFKTRRQGIMQL